MQPRRFALIDDRLVEDSLLLRRSLGKPELKQREPVLDPGHAFGSVLRDNDGQWRMWYSTFITCDPASSLVGSYTPQHLALSRDGINWEKPTFGSIAGYDDPNIILDAKQRDDFGRYLSGHCGIGGFCVLDNETHPHPYARSRFTALYGAFPLDTVGGILLAHSDDGIRWRAYEENPVLPGNQDTQNILLYDSNLGQYVCFHRPMLYCGVTAHANRKMARSTSNDLVHWSPGQIVLDTDERDAPAWDFYDEPGNGHRGRLKQFQGMTPWVSNDCYLALAWMYDAPAGTFQLELLHSPDGISWQREALRQAFIGDGLPDGFAGKVPVPMGAAPILVGDEEFFYCSTTPYGHHEGTLAYLGSGELNEEKRRAYLETTSIYLLAIKRDRWVGYEAGEREGELLTRPIKWEGGRLCLNIKIRDGGYLRLQLEDEWGRPHTDLHLDEIPAITGPLDTVDHPVTFGPGPKSIIKLPPGDKVRLRFWLKDAALFGWSLQ